MATDTIQNDLEVARRLLRQTQEQFDMLEFKISKLKYNFQTGSFVEFSRSVGIVNQKFKLASRRIEKVN